MIHRRNAIIEGRREQAVFPGWRGCMIEAGHNTYGVQEIADDAMRAMLDEHEGTSHASGRPLYLSLDEDRNVLRVLPLPDRTYDVLVNQ